LADVSFSFFYASRIVFCTNWTKKSLWGSFSELNSHVRHNRR
jgi:predicted TIM-barrel fold metal-dependent hydrolase